LALAKVGIELAKLQTILFAENKRKVLIVLQGMDTSGKDGTTKAIFSQLNPLAARAVAFKKPELKELAHDFLWRVHAQVPASGELVVFNRSHYEDVLVPLVHGSIDNEECKRRYQHIVNFEKLLTDTDTIILKFFLHISKSEQKRESKKE